MLKQSLQLISNDQQYFTVADAVAFFRIGKNTIYRALSNREIYHNCVGRKKIIKRADIEKWLRKRSRNVIDQPQKPLKIVNNNKSPNTTPEDSTLDEIFSFIDSFEFEGPAHDINPDYRIDIDNVCEWADGSISVSVTRRLAS
jgi:excisionase family DNA binding protein